MIVTLADPFLAQNAGRRYPFADNTAMPDGTDAAVLDLRISLRRGSTGIAYLARLVSVEHAEITGKVYKLLTVAVNPEPVAGAGNVLVFSIPYDINDTQPYVATATASGMIGEMTVSAAVVNFPETVKDVPFSPAVVVCRGLEVDSVQGTRGIDSTKMAVISGEIFLDQGYNTDPYIDGQRIRLDITKGGGIGERCQVAETGQNCDNILFTVNGERPGSSGELRIVGENGIVVTPDADNHAIVVSLTSTAADKMSETCEPNC